VADALAPRDALSRSAACFARDCGRITHGTRRREAADRRRYFRRCFLASAGAGRFFPCRCTSIPRLFPPGPLGHGLGTFLWLDAGGGAVGLPWLLAFRARPGRLSTRTEPAGTLKRYGRIARRPQARCLLTCSPRRAFAGSKRQPPPTCLGTLQEWQLRVEGPPDCWAGLRGARRWIETSRPSRVDSCWRLPAALRTLTITTLAWHPLQPAGEEERSCGRRVGRWGFGSPSASALDRR
jgi:hypothetical protein